MIYAEDVNYWKTGKSSTDIWLDRAKKEVLKAKGKIYGSGFIEEEITGKASYMLAFELDGEYFKILWPVLRSKNNDLKAARIQARPPPRFITKSRPLASRSNFLAHARHFLPT